MAHHYVAVPWQFGDILVIWRTEDGPTATARRVLLPDDPAKTEMLLRIIYADATPGTNPAIEALAADMSRYLNGEQIEFGASLPPLEDCTPFQRLVLAECRAVPRGAFTTYGDLAERIGHPSAARAVGTALANNPLPILIPCHRAVRADGHMGGFVGGIAGLPMKRALLALEGVAICERGRAIIPQDD